MYRLWLLPFLLLAACGAPTATGPIPPPTEAAKPTVSSRPAAVEAKADALLARARELEPAISDRLRLLARTTGGKLVGLEHRFKTRESTLRKIRQRMVQKQLTADEVVIDDALRYTMRIEDEPPGHYNDSVRAILRTLEGDGHTVTKVKNYWPRGDNYSGVNTILRTADGFSWELQFHTAASLATQREGHPLYEEMRRISTPTRRKQELFDQLAAPWQSVPIPAEVLEEHSLHPVEQIIRRPRPQ